MNAALFHAARPGDIGGGGVGPDRVGMREAAGMARQMGFGKEEVANAWKMLDDLAETDDDAYKEIQEAAADHMKRGSKATGQGFFIPNPGFVVKTSLAQPYHESIVCHEGGSGPGGRRGCSPRKVSESAPSGTKVFINICCHEGVPPPKDLADKAVDVSSEGRNASGLRMPMYCSRVRETVDHKEERSLAIDVVFHPWVIRSSRSEWRFRDQVVNLAAGWIMKENPGMVLNSRQRKLLKLNTYKGGRGPQGGMPLPFSADDANAQNVGPEARGNSDAVASTQACANRPPEMRNRNGRTRDDGSYSGSGRCGLLDESMKDPESFLTARRNFSSTATEAQEGGGGIPYGIKGPEKSSQSEGRDIGAAELLGFGNRAGGAPRGKNADGIRLPAGLAGLADAESEDNGGGGDRGEHLACKTRKNRGPLISEISSPIARGKEQQEFGQKGDGNNLRRDAPAGVGIHVRESTGRRRRQPAVKKGFLEKLNGKVSPLYPPEGSENGADEAPMMKLMRKSKVVDTRDLSKQEVEAAMKAHAGGKALSPRRQQHSSGNTRGSTAKERKDSAVKKGFLEAGSGGALYGDEGSCEGTGGRRPGQNIDPEFERLVAMADPEIEAEKPKEEDEDPLVEQLAQLAKILGPQTAGGARRDSDATTFSQAESTVVCLPPPPGVKESATLGDKQPEQHQKQQESAEKDIKDGSAGSTTETLGCSHDKVNGVGARVGSIDVRSAPAIKPPTVSQQDHEVESTEDRPVEGVERVIVKERKTEVPERVVSDDVARFNEPRGLSREVAQIEKRYGEVDVNDPPEGPAADMAGPAMTAAAEVKTRHAGQTLAASKRAERVTDSSARTQTANANKDGKTIISTVPLFSEEQRRRSASPEKAPPHELSQKAKDGSNGDENETSGNALAGKAGEVTNPNPCREERQPKYRIEECMLLHKGDKSDGAGGSITGDRRRGVMVVVDLPDVASATRQWDEGTDTVPRTGPGSQRRKFSLRDVELDVLSDSLDLRVPGLYRLHLQMPFPVEKDDVTAKFSKAWSTLTISAREE